MATFSVGIIAFDDISPTPSTSETVGETGTFSVSPTAVPITLVIEDDDDEFDDGFIDPPGFSTGANNQTLVNAVTVNGTTFPAGSQVELEFSVTTEPDAANPDGQLFHYVRIDGVNVGIGGPTLPQPGQTFTSSEAFDGQEMLFSAIVCFTAGTQIDTPSGPRAIEVLSPGDLVSVSDAPPEPLRWIGTRTVSVADLIARPHLAPITISAGALGNRCAIQVSPQHRILKTMPSGQEVLVPAKALVNGRTIYQTPPRHPVTYVHILFAAHQIVSTGGLLSESFFPGSYILTAMEAAAREEIFEIFPSLRTMPESYGAPARQVLRAGEAQRLLA